MSSQRRATMKAVNDLVPTVNACLRDMWPDVDPITGRFLNDHLAALPAARQTRCLRRRADERDLQL